MKLLALLFLISCASHQTQVHKTSGIAPRLNPYVENFKLNHPSGKSAAQTAFPVNFSSQVKTVGVCYLREKMADREILINEEIWNNNPEKRQYIVNYLLSACYGFTFATSPYYEIHLTSY